MAATKETLQQIHEKVAQAYLKLLEKWEDNPELLNPAAFGHINKFLQQNGIEALAVVDSPLDKLRQKGKLYKLPRLEDNEREAVSE